MSFFATKFVSLIRQFSGQIVLAYTDTNPGPGLHTYTLFAVNTEEEKGFPAKIESILFAINHSAPKGYINGDSGTMTGTKLAIQENTVTIYLDEYKDHTPKLTSVTFSDTLTAIGESAFSTNRLTSLKIPDSVATIGEGAFEKNQLKSIDFGNRITSIPLAAFQNNASKSLTIPDSVTTIDGYAFYDNNQLRNLDLGNNV